MGSCPTLLSLGFETRFHGQQSLATRKVSPYKDKAAGSTDHAHEQESITETPFE